MRRTINILAVVLALSWPISPWAQSAACTPLKSVPVTVDLLDPKPKINHTKTLDYINSQAKHGGLRVQNGIVLGLTSRLSSSSFGVELSYQALGNQYCVNITKVNGKYGLKDLEVFVPREYYPGTCQYNTVMRHEKEHVRINREGARKYAKLFRKELAKAVYRFNPKQYKNLEIAKNDAQKALGGAMRRINKKFEVDLQKKHAIVDKPGGPYDATGACRKWK